MITLEWYCDSTFCWYGHQQAFCVACYVGAEVQTVGTYWQKAVWTCESEEQATERWWYLIREYNVNAMTWHR